MSGWTSQQGGGTGGASAPAPVAYAALPAAAGHAGESVLVTDVGVGGGSLWVSNGSIWVPPSPLCLWRLPAIATIGNNGGANVQIAQIAIPRGLWRAGGSLGYLLNWNQVGGTLGPTVTIYLGANGNATDPQIMVVGSTAAKQGQFVGLVKRQSATAVRRTFGPHSTSGAWFTSAGAAQSDVAVPSLDANDLILSIHGSVSGTETFDIQNGLITLY